MLPIAIQLYTVRDQAAADFEGTLKAIKAMGMVIFMQKKICLPDILIIRQVCTIFRNRVR